mgnify:CR=1 FL=1
MAIIKKIKKRFYQDSLKLMRVSAEIKEMPGVDKAFAFMATEINKQTRIQASLMDEDVIHAGADDLVMLIECENEELGFVALEAFEQSITSIVKSSKDGEVVSTAPTTIEQAKEKLDANLAIISVPGVYATVQTLIALNQGMNVMLFSDNVSIGDEIALKEYAIERDLLVMGPDCGTAIINGVPLCFANVVKRGSIGVIGASGTGTQELTVQLDEQGLGISHAIGTGGRDLSLDCAARTTLFALDLLRKDKQTEIIALISKPPSPLIAKHVLEAVLAVGKPAVLAFLGSESRKVSNNVYVAGTIEEAVAKIVAISRGEDADQCIHIHARKAFDHDNFMSLSPSQKLIKGFFTGGTLASEAKYILKDFEADILDLGDDEFTRGALHPMIDPTIRNEYIAKAFQEEDVAVILCDVVLGFGSHPNPAVELANIVEASQKKTTTPKIVIASVVGTEADPQIKSKQVQILLSAGIHVYPSNQYAAEIAAGIARRVQKVREV